MPRLLQHVCMLSGGVASWAAAKRVVEQYGTDQVTLLFADTLTEHWDTYRFLEDCVKDLGARYVKIADGRNIWKVFKDRKFLGNSRVDLCSRILKRELMDKWIEDNYKPHTVRCYVGLDWSEEHRYTRMRDRKLPWQYFAPLCEPPYLTKTDYHKLAAASGLKKQVLYEHGASHANCGGGCIKMGIGGFTRLYQNLPQQFASWEQGEEECRKELGDVSILREQRNGIKYNITLRELRLRIESEGTDGIDMFAIGGCGCFVDEE